MKHIRIIHMGIGNVGSLVSQMLFSYKSEWENHLDRSIRIVGICTSKGGRWNSRGLDQSDIEAIKQNDYTTDNLFSPKHFDERTILIDTTASKQMLPTIQMALKQGSYVVLSNKNPLSDKQRHYVSIHTDRLYYETTVGAGLPIISTLKDMRATGDEIKTVRGCFSGTLGFITSELEKNNLYSHSIQLAMKKGFTEPDPRDDLSGFDVARKGLILARLMGLQTEFDQVSIQPMYDSSLSKVPVEEFLEKSAEQNNVYQEQFKQARAKTMTLRYTCSISSDEISVGLSQVAKHSNIGSLNGPDNIVVIKSKRYNLHPLVIQGPGAGKEVTAAGVVADVLKVIQRIQ